MRLAPTAADRCERDRVIAALGHAIRDDIRVLLPLPSNPDEAPSFGGTVGPYRYLFEGEDDLLHLIVERLDGGPLTPEEGQAVSAFLLPKVAPGVIWLKPGRLSQHFYLGHDEIVSGQPSPSPARESQRPAPEKPRP